MFVDFNILNQLGSPSINSNTFANRPSAGQVGRLFVSTDTFEIYRDNGTGWDLIGGPGSSTVTGSGAAGQVTYWTGTNSVGGENNLWWDAANNHFGINTSTPGVALDVHSAADVGMQLNGTGGTPNIYIDFLQTGTSQYRLGYTDGAVDDRRFSIYDVTGAKEVLTIDKQTRYVGINFQYSSLTDQPQYMLDLSGGSFHTNVGQYLVGTPTDLTRSFAASGNANSIAVWLEEYGNVTASADIFFIKGRGTDTAKLNVQVGDSLGGMAFTGYLNAQYNQSMTWGSVVTNLDTTNNHANADFTIAQSYNTSTLTENFRVIANGGNAYLRGKLGLGLTPVSDRLEVNGNISLFGNVLYNGAASNSCGISLAGSAIRIDGFFGVTIAASAATVGSQTIRMFVSPSTGNVIINNGSTDNGNKLQVNGNISVNGGIRFLDFLTPSTNYFDVYNYGVDNTWRINYNGAGNDELILSSTGVLTIGASYRSGAPNGGTAANWKLGTRVAAAVVLDATQYIELDVNGTLYKLAIVT